jgi:pyruvate formate lyase activating enzyme
LDNPPLIFDIQRSSFEDGPGIRTIVFLKGCPLRCTWCHNPESQSTGREILWFKEQCTGCDSCYAACKNDAVNSHDNDFRIDKSKCVVCCDCVEACNYNALRAAGKAYTAELLAAELLRDKTYFDVSGGGVTFSGGEPLMFIEYLAEVCESLKNEKIDIAIQTCGHFNFGMFDKLLSMHISTIYFDLKLAGESRHFEHTGKSNALILENLRKLFSPKKHRIIIRTPLIHSITDTPENLSGVRELISRFDHDGYEELMFNDSYHKKLTALGRVR